MVPPAVVAVVVTAGGPLVAGGGSNGDSVVWLTRKVTTSMAAIWRPLLSMATVTRPDELRLVTLKSSGTG